MPMQQPDCQQTSCHITFLGRSRNSKLLRYWCRTHRRLVASDSISIAPVACKELDVDSPQKVLMLDVSKYLGGVGLWGALPPILNTSNVPVERGVHVHARVKPDGLKEI